MMLGLLGVLNTFFYLFSAYFGGFSQMLRKICKHPSVCISIHIYLIPIKQHTVHSTLTPFHNCNSFPRWRETQFSLSAMCFHITSQLLTVRNYLLQHTFMYIHFCLCLYIIKSKCYLRKLVRLIVFLPNTLEQSC